MSASTLMRGIPARTFSDIQLQVAATREEREAVFRLIYQSYYGAGLCEASATEMRYTPYQLLPTTDLFLAQLQEEIICTLSLVRDGALGLPMEDLYGEQVRERRADGLALAEVSCLADRRNEPSRFFDLFCDLSRLMVQLAEEQCVDQLLIAVHPRHAALYTRYMAFQRIGERRDYSAVNGNPAVPLCLDFNEIRVKRPPCWDRFFGEKIATEFLQTNPISDADRDYFLDLAKSNDYNKEHSEFTFDQEIDAEHALCSALSETLLCA